MSTPASFLVSQIEIAGAGEGGITTPPSQDCATRTTPSSLCQELQQAKALSILCSARDVDQPSFNWVTSNLLLLHGGSIPPSFYVRP